MNPNEQNNQPNLSFEGAFNRLEEILGHLNTETVSLDESIRLYEEADKLISVCSKLLNDAERKIEILVKNRQGELVIGSDGRPTVQDYR